MFNYVYVAQRSPIAVSLPMPYIVIKTIKGKQYRYQQRSYREGGRVRTESIYMGPIGGGTRRKGLLLRRIGDLIEANRSRVHHFDEEALMREAAEKKAERDRAVTQAQDLYWQKLGLSNPMAPPVPSSPVSKEDAPSESTDGAEDQ
jgi:hypothetical protein